MRTVRHSSGGSPSRRRFRVRRLRPAVVGIAAVALSLGTATATAFGSASPAHAATPAAATAPARAAAAAAAAKPTAKPTTATASASAADQEARAVAQAKATGRSVTVDALTTPTSTITANPHGTLTLDQFSAPVRRRDGSRWVPLDATLHRNADATLSPAESTAGLVLSGGGSGPLAVLTNLGESLSLSWPAPLPAPTIAGATATYAAVLPGVDLVVTATDQGGLSEVLVVKDRRAAADPRLAALRLATRTDGGLAVSSDAAGRLTVAGPGRNAVPVFTADTALMWDSSGTGPKSSGIDGPGAHARVAKVKTTASTGTLTLVPDQNLLTAPGTKYPVYVDPTLTPNYSWASGSIKAFSLNNIGGGGITTSDLQVGYEGWDGQDFTARGFVRVGVDSRLAGASVITSSIHFSYTENTASGCAPASGTELWWIAGLPSSPTWSNFGDVGSTWLSRLGTDQLRWGSGCSAADENAGYDLTSFMRSNATSGKNAFETFGLRASDESSENGWKEFSTKVEMQTEFNRPPAAPAYSATSPGGLCTDQASNTDIGLDDLTLSTVAADPEGGQVQTRFVVKNASGQTVFDSATQTANGVASPITTSGGTASVLIPRTMATSTAWNATAATAANAYTWYTVTTDGALDNSGDSGLGTAKDPCAFTYDPTQPSSPVIAAPTTQADGSIGSIGGTATLQIAYCSGVLDTPQQPCTGAGGAPATVPNRYVYQVNQNAPVTVTATGPQTPITLPLTHVGANVLTVYALSASGNPSGVSPQSFQVDGLTGANKYPDGAFLPGGKPDVLAVGTGNNPGLWLAPTDGAGTVATSSNGWAPVTDFGAEGSGLNIPGTAADWTGADVLHGDFTGHGVQDVIAYYPQGVDKAQTDPSTPNAGRLFLQAGGGDGLTLPGVAQNLVPNTFQDANGNDPIQLVGAGDASLTNEPVADLIGIDGDPTDGYTLDLYTGQSFTDYNNPNGTGPIPLSGAAIGTQPPGGGTWDDYTLVAAQPTVPGGTAKQTALFALDSGTATTPGTGTLWEAVNTTDGTTTSWNLTSPVASRMAWTQVTSVPWTAASIPHLTYGDVDSAGTVELWSASGLTATSYALTAPATLTQQSASSIFAPNHEWPLTGPDLLGSTGQTADTTGGADATLSPSGSGFSTDALHGSALTLDGKSGYAQLPSNLTAGSSGLTLTLSFKAKPGTSGILFSTGHATPDQNNSASDPAMYIGTDGHLYGEWWDGAARPMISPTAVDDGQWHTATLLAANNTQSLYIDNNVRVGMAGVQALGLVDPEDFLGAGVFNDDTTKTWPNAPGKPTGSGTTVSWPSWFTGQIADVSFFNAVLNPWQLPGNHPTDQTGTVKSSVPVSGGLCLDDLHQGTANGTVVDVYTCNNSAAQRWIATTGETVEYAADPSMCLDITGAGTANGTKVELWTCNGGANQQWRLESAGQLWNPAAKKCLDDPDSSTTPGTQLQIYDCNFSDAQNWIAP